MQHFRGLYFSWILPFYSQICKSGWHLDDIQSWSHLNAIQAIVLLHHFLLSKENIIHNLVPSDSSSYICIYFHSTSMQWYQSLYFLYVISYLVCLWVYSVLIQYFWPFCQKLALYRPKYNYGLYWFHVNATKSLFHYKSRFLVSVDLLYTLIPNHLKGFVACNVAVVCKTFDPWPPWTSMRTEPWLSRTPLLRIIAQNAWKPKLRLNATNIKRFKTANNLTAQETSQTLLIMVCRPWVSLKVICMPKT